MTAAEAEHRRIGFVDPPADAARVARSLEEAYASLSETDRSAAATGDMSLSANVEAAIEYLGAMST